MKTVGAYEAKTRLAALLEQVAEGERFTITKHGVPVAMLVPPPGSRQEDPKAAIDAWRQYRLERNLSLGPNLTIRAMIDEGRP
jgi:prevent-host-death family protein